MIPRALGLLFLLSISSILSSNICVFRFLLVCENETCLSVNSSRLLIFFYLGHVEIIYHDEIKIKKVCK